MNDLKNDIERYLKGEMTPSEMHALEKKTLSDPFLADALEGASEVSTDSFEQDVRDLQMLIDQRTNQSKKIIPMWNWSLRIAAGLALIAVSTLVILNIASDNEPVQLAENKIKSEPPATEQKEPLLDSIEQPKTTFSLSESKPLATQPPPLAKLPAEKPTIVTEPSSVSSQPAMANADVSAPEKVGEQNVIIERAEAEEVRIAAVETSTPISVKKFEVKEDVSKDAKRKKVGTLDGYANTGAADKAITNNARTIKGHVSSLEDGSALPGVNVIVKGTEVGTVTDAEGNYEITLADIKDELVFSFIGLQSTELDAGSSDQLDVQMSNDVSELSEVVVTGYAVNRDTEDEDEDKALELASPVGGRKAYKQYLDKNLRYPVVALENKIEGKVTIEFTVGTTGALSEFKVVRSLGYGCDEEVIRLVKDGARWTPSKYGNELVESNVKIKLRFSLPKK